MKIYNDLGKAIVGGWQYTLDYGKLVDQEYWQGLEVSHMAFEALDFMFRSPMPESIKEAQSLIKPNLPWADKHFLERVSGDPLNPPPSHEIWPFSQRSNDKFRKDNKFDHTYPERFWPKKVERESSGEEKEFTETIHRKGIRFEYGDLYDVIHKLRTDLKTRQAYLPIWFPEDTGKNSSIRVPCTLGYFFMVRNGRLDIKYIMRSTDMIRHFQDDIYMCYRLAKFVHEFLTLIHKHVKLGYMTFITFSAHVFEGEEKVLQKIINLKEKTKYYKK